MSAPVVTGSPRPPPTHDTHTNTSLHESFDSFEPARVCFVLPPHATAPPRRVHASSSTQSQSPSSSSSPPSFASASHTPMRPRKEGETTVPSAAEAAETGALTRALLLRPPSARPCRKGPDARPAGGPASASSPSAPGLRELVHPRPTTRVGGEDGADALRPTCAASAAWKASLYSPYAARTCRASASRASSASRSARCCSASRDDSTTAGRRGAGSTRGGAVEDDARCAARAAWRRGSGACVARVMSAMCLGIATATGLLRSARCGVSPTASSGSLSALVSPSLSARSPSTRGAAAAADGGGLLPRLSVGSDIARYASSAGEMNETGCGAGRPGTPGTRGVTKEEVEGGRQGGCCGSCTPPR